MSLHALTARLRALAHGFGWLLCPPSGPRYACYSQPRPHFYP